MAGTPYQPSSPDQVQDETTDPSYYTSGQAAKELPSTLGQSLDASMSLGEITSPVAHLGNLWAISRLRSQGDQNNSTKLSPEELNRMYPQVEKPFTEPEYPTVASYIGQLADQKRTFQQQIENGPSGRMAGFAKWAAGLIPHALDPINMAAFEIGGAALRAKGLFQPIVDADGKVISDAFGNVVARTAISNVTGMASTEPLNYAGAQAEHDNWSVGGAAENVLGGALIGTGIHLGIEGLGRLRGRVNEVKARVAASQMEQGKPVDTSAVEQDFQAEINPPRSPDNPSVIANPDGLVSGDFYAATTRPHGNLTPEETHALDDAFPEGLHLTDHEGTANGHAGSKYNGIDGDVAKVRVDGMRSLDITDVKPEDLGVTVEQAKADGYEGVHRTVGEGDSKRANLMPFDPENPKLSEVSRAPADPSRIPEITPEAYQQLAEQSDSFKNSLSHDEDSWQKTLEATNNEPDSPKLADAKQSEADAIEHIQGLIDQGHLPKEAQDLVDSVKEAGKGVEDQAKVAKAAMICLGRAI